MTDLIKFLRTSTSSAYNKTAADRIEELETRNKDLALQLLATSGQAADALDKLTECEARLSKAVEALQWYADFGNYLSNRGDYAPIDLDKGGKAEDTLAELEGK